MSGGVEEFEKPFAFGYAPLATFFMVEGREEEVMV
jgi:hypothetical protein